MGGSNNSSNSSSSTGTGSQGYSSSTSGAGGGSAGGGANSSPTAATSTSNNSDQLSRTNLYIRGLTPNTTDKDLEELCRKYVTRHSNPNSLLLIFSFLSVFFSCSKGSAPSSRPKPFSTRIPTSAKATVSSISSRHPRPSRPSKPCSFKAFKRRWRR